MEEKILQKNGNNIHYYCSSVLQQRETIVFIHGLTSHAMAWRKSADRFQKKYNVIALNLPGHRKTTLSRNPFARAVSDVCEVLIEENIAQAHFVGQCIGPYVLFALYQHCPKIVRSLTLTSGNYTSPTKNFFSQDLSILKHPLLLFLKMYSYLDSLHKYLRIPQPNFSEYSNRDLTLFYLRNSLATSPLTIYEYYRAMFRLDFTTLLPRIDVPTLVMSATNDTIFCPRIARDMAHRIPSSTLYVIRGDHSFAYKKSDEFNGVLESFLRESF